jgi:hypothetical protein
VPGPAVTAASAPVTEPAGRPLNSLNWTEEQLAEQEEKIIATVKAALEVAPSPMQNQKNAKQLALAGIRKLPRPLRNLLLHRFEKNSWRQLSLPGSQSGPPTPEWRWHLRGRLPIAQSRLTSESEITREAMIEYLARHKITTTDLREAQTQYHVKRPRKPPL